MNSPQAKTGVEVERLPELPEPKALKTPEDGEIVSCDDGMEPYFWAWGAHGYDTGMEPFFDADQMRAYATAALAAEREEVERLMGDLRASEESRLELRKALEPYAKFGFSNQAHNELARRVFFGGPSADYPECSGDPSSCPENEGCGCCAALSQPQGGNQS